VLSTHICGTGCDDESAKEIEREAVVTVTVSKSQGMEVAAADSGGYLQCLRRHWTGFCL